MSTTSTSLLKPALSYQNLIEFFSAFKWFFDDERRNQLFHGSERQGTGIMSKLSVYGREETKT